MTVVGDATGYLLNNTPQVKLYIDILRPTGCTMTVDDHRDELNAALQDDGMICRCCEQPVHRWRRDPTSTMVRVLLCMYKVFWQRANGHAFCNDPAMWEYWVHTPTLLQYNMMPNTHEIATFEHWGVIDSECSHFDYARGVAAVIADPTRAQGFYDTLNKPRVRGASRRSMGQGGYFTITDTGAAFVEGQIGLPRYIHIYNERVVYIEDLDGPDIYIDDVLPGFDLAAFLRAGLAIDPDDPAAVRAANMTQRKRKRAVNVAATWRAWGRWAAQTGTPSPTPTPAPGQPVSSPSPSPAPPAGAGGGHNHPAYARGHKTP